MNSQVPHGREIFLKAESLSAFQTYVAVCYLVYSSGDVTRFIIKQGTRQRLEENRNTGSTAFVMRKNLNLGTKINLLLYYIQYLVRDLQKAQRASLERPISQCCTGM
jgi:uncharacterized protein YbgA (DUF1722 family)